MLLKTFQEGVKKRFKKKNDTKKWEKNYAVNQKINVQ